MGATPKHIIAVSAFVTNNENEVLLTKVQWRLDTWELPGGQVEEGEALDKAVATILFIFLGFLSRKNDNRIIGNGMLVVGVMVYQ